MGTSQHTRYHYTGLTFMAVSSELVENGVMTEPRFRFSTATMLVAVLLVCCILGAYSRGNFLFGQRGAIIYTVIASLIALLYLRALSRVPLPRVWLVVLTLLAFSVSLAFAFPAYLNPEVQYGIDDQRVDRLARAELAALLAEDPAFESLQVSTTHRKIVGVEIEGTVPTQDDLVRLRTSVMEGCEFPESCLVYWNIAVGEDGTTFTG